MSIEFESAKRLDALKQGIEAKTGKTYADLTDGVNALIAGYGQGGGGVPLKGFVPSEWNDAGLVTKGTLYGMTAIPNGFFMVSANANESSFFRGLTEVTFAEDIVEFGDNAFKSTPVSFAELPSTLQSIGSSCFWSCSNLSIATLPDGITTLEGQSFQNCRKITLKKLPAGLTKINAYAFQNCERITVSEIPAGVVELGKQCFSGCRGITSIAFKGTPTTIASDVFNSTVNLTNIYVPWAEGAVANAPWGATYATIHYNTIYDENGDPVE